MNKIIGICGVARSGKDTLCEIMQQIFPERNISRLAFADALKNECEDFLKDNLGISPFTTDEREKELIRPFLVTYGTHLRRKLNPNCWIEILSDTIRKRNGNNDFAITDARYPNEVEWIKSMGGTVIHVSRAGIKPANPEEKFHDPLLKQMADIKISIPTFKEDYFSKCRTTIENKLKKPLIWS